MTNVRSTETVTPGTPAPRPSITFATIAVVPPVPMTGFVVDRVRVAIGAGGPTVISSRFTVVAVEVPFVATAVRVRSPWMTGTIHANRAWPLTSVVADVVRNEDPKLAFRVTVAPLTGPRFCATNASTFTVCPPRARSGTVSATEKTPDGGGT